MTLLDVSGVRKTFGPLVAVADVTLTVEMNQIVGLIGPNGSGKSTLLHTICGRGIADGGAITLDGREITRMSSVGRARAGMAIKFQLARVYVNRSIRDNLLLALQAEQSLAGLMVRNTRRRHEERLQELVTDFGLTGREDERAGALSHGEQQWLEIAMAMARRPSLLLLDEPTGGMSPREREETGRLIRKAAEHCGVLIVEHDLAFIRALCHQITVLHQGTVVASGTPAEIEADPRVQEVYLTRV